MLYEKVNKFGLDGDLGYRISICSNLLCAIARWHSRWLRRFMEHPLGSRGEPPAVACSLRRGRVELRSHREAVIRVTVARRSRFWWIRELLEPAAARRAAKKMTPGRLWSLEATITKMERLSPLPDPSRWLALNRAYHLRIYRAAERPYLLRLITELFDHSTRCIRGYLKSAEQFAVANCKHRPLLASWFG